MSSGNDFEMELCDTSRSDMKHQERNARPCLFSGVEDWSGRPWGGRKEGSVPDWSYLEDI